MNKENTTEFDSVGDLITPQEVEEMISEENMRDLASRDIPSVLRLMEQFKEYNITLREHSDEKLQILASKTYKVRQISAKLDRPEVSLWKKVGLYALAGVVGAGAVVFANNYFYKRDVDMVKKEMKEMSSKFTESVERISDSYKREINTMRKEMHDAQQQFNKLITDTNKQNQEVLSALVDKLNKAPEAKGEEKNERLQGMVDDFKEYVKKQNYQQAYEFMKESEETYDTNEHKLYSDLLQYHQKLPKHLKTLTELASGRDRLYLLGCLSKLKRGYTFQMRKQIIQDIRHDIKKKRGYTDLYETGKQLLYDFDDKETARQIQGLYEKHFKK